MAETSSLLAVDPALYHAINKTDVKLEDVEYILILCSSKPKAVTVQLIVQTHFEQNAATWKKKKSSFIFYSPLFQSKHMLPHLAWEYIDKNYTKALF